MVKEGILETFKTLDFLNSKKESKKPKQGLILSNRKTFFQGENIISIAETNFLVNCKLPKFAPYFLESEKFVQVTTIPRK